MRIKKYNTSDMQEAMTLIREELGPEAIIISSQRLPRRSLREFFKPARLEVTAAVEESKEVELPAPAISAGPVAIPYTVRTRAPRNADGLLDVERGGEKRERLIPGHLQPARLPEPLLPIETRAWHFDSMLTGALEKMGENGMSEDLLNRWKKVLQEREVHPRILEPLFADLDNFNHDHSEPDEMLKITLRSRISRLVEPAYSDGSCSRIHTFIGPTGVGKTTTLLKLATRKKVFEQKNIALVAVYTHRYGALEKLKYYGEIIGVPVEVVMTPGELLDAVNAHRDKDQILIDTEGRPSKNTSQVLELKSFLEAVGQAQDIYLVLSCTTRDRDLERITADFQKLKFTRLIFTKLDETDTYGAMLNIICKVGAPVSYITSGQNIPDDIQEIQHKNFAALIV
ncbi:MAG: flagellar biosynthesis protein FlhF [Bacillota bacterium]|jgi:flagellar biosynthesis protein FlhF